MSSRNVARRSHCRQGGERYVNHVCRPQPGALNRTRSLALFKNIRLVWSSRGKGFLLCDTLVTVASSQAVDRPTAPTTVIVQQLRMGQFGAQSNHARGTMHQVVLIMHNSQRLGKDRFFFAVYAAAAFNLPRYWRRNLATLGAITTWQ